MKNLNKILGGLSMLLTFIMSAQDTTLFVGDTFFVSPGTIVSVQGHTINKDHFYNNGNVTLNGNYHSRPASRLHNADTIWCSGNWIQITGKNDTLYKGTVVFNGSGPQLIAKSYFSENFYSVVFAGGGVKTLNGNMLVDSTVEFVNGNVVTSASDTFALIDGTVYGGGLASHVNGRFYNAGFGQLRYPIGIGTQYREAIIENVPISAEMPVIGFQFMNSPHGGTSGPNVYSIEPNFYWRAYLRSGQYAGSLLTLRHLPGDGLVAGESSIVQADSVDGEYSSIGYSNFTAGYITSEFIAGEDFYTFGRSANMNADLRVYLQGAMSGFSMQDTLYSRGELDQYLDGNLNSLGMNMLPGYNLPVLSGSGPIDYVTVYLRSTPSGSNLDTSYAWLMTNGAIRDFYTGTKAYTTFKNYTTLNPGDPYYMVVDHRNHLPAMNNTALNVTQDTTSGSIAYYNLSAIGNVYGGGAYLDGFIAEMYYGNADTDKFFYSKYIVDADDFDKVRIPALNTMPSGYLSEDVNMDGDVNSLDWDITKTGVDNMYYSKVPF